MDYIKRFSKLIFGLLLFSLGYYLAIQANIGLAPWSAFSTGVSEKLGTSFGTVTTLTAIVIMGINLLLKETIGWGTIFDTLLVGAFIDGFNYINPVPLINNFWLSLIVLIVDSEIIAIGSWFYLSAALGAGPRDTLMVALCKRLPKLPVGVVRCFIEGIALLVGWLLGARVGVGTVISVFGLGFFIQFTFKLFKFDVKIFKNESFVETVKLIKQQKSNKSNSQMPVTPP